MATSRCSTKGPPGNKGINSPPVSSADSAKNWDVYPLTDPKLAFDTTTGLFSATAISAVLMFRVRGRDHMNIWGAWAVSPAVTV